MAIDPSKLKPSDLTRLLNSTSLGTVIDDRQLYRHRQRAGFRISPDGRTVNLFKYLAWLMDERHGPQPEQIARDYEAMKEAARARNAALPGAAPRTDGRHRVRALRRHRPVADGPLPCRPKDGLLTATARQTQRSPVPNLRLIPATCSAPPRTPVPASAATVCLSDPCSRK